MQAELGNKKKLRWMIVLMATAIMAVAYDFRGVFDTAPPKLPSTTAPATQKRPARMQTDREMTLHLESLLNQEQRFEIGARNLFRMQEPAPQRKDPDPPPNPGGQLLADPPKPSLPLTFYGFADRRNEPRRIFLQDGQGIFLARLGDTVAGRYKVLEISRESVTIEDTLQNFQQRVPLLSK